MKQMKQMGRIFIVGLTLVIMGFYATATMAGETAVKEECVAKVKAAVEMAEKQGLDAAYQKINDKKGPFVWKDSYVFALSADMAVPLAHPYGQKMIGRNLLHYKDAGGKLIFAEFIRVGTAPEYNGEGWVDYMWNKPGEKTPTPKTTYIMRVPGENVIMCAGYYK